MKNKTKKFFITLLLILVLCNFLPVNAFATFITDMNSSAEFGVIPDSLAIYGHELHYATYDGTTYIVFCMQKGTKSPGGDTYKYGSEFEAIVNDESYKQIAEMIYFGYTSVYGYGLPSSDAAQKAACCTQEYVWESLGFGDSESTWVAYYMNPTLYSSWLNETTEKYNSYHTDVSFNNLTKKVNYGTNIITDTNGVLKDYDTFSKTSNEVTFSHTKGSNDLVITVSSTVTGTAFSFNSKSNGIYKLMPNGDAYNSSIMSSYIYFNFESGSVQNLMFSNYVNPSYFAVSIDVESGEITLEKTDIDTGNENRVDGSSHHGDASLNGAIYTLYANEDIKSASDESIIFAKDQEIANFTFNEYGQIINIEILNGEGVFASDSVLKGLPYGFYYVKETTAPNGYNLDETKHIYEIGSSQTSINDIVEDVVKKAKFEIIKVSADSKGEITLVENAEFTAILTKYVDFYGSFEDALNHLDEFADDEYSIFTTESNGHGLSCLLAYGEYTVYETVTPSGYNTVAPFTVVIDENSDGAIKEFVKNDRPFEAYLKIVKYDEETGKTITFSGATFELYKLNDLEGWEKVSCKIGSGTYDKWSTDKEGIAYTETKLGVGTYKIVELEAPNGYLLSNEEIIFNIDENNETLEYDDDYDAYITVKVGNEKPTGNLIIEKTVDLGEFEDILEIDTSDLSSISFSLYAKENVIDYLDGSIIYSNGEKIGTYNVDENGYLLIEDLPMGTYEVKEDSTLDGLILDENSYEVAFIQEDETTKLYTKNLNIVNYLYIEQPVEEIVQTGNDINYNMFSNLMAISLSGIAAVVMKLIRSKK